MTQLPGSLGSLPRLSAWIDIDPGGSVRVRSGKVEIGQGIVSALAQLVADELDVAVQRIHMVPVVTDISPDEGYTAGSMSVERSGEALRQVCAEVRALFLAEAADRLEAALADLTVHDGVIAVRGGGGGELTYWEVAPSVSLDRNATGVPAPKGPADRRLIGSSVPRLDVPAKLRGAPAFLHDHTAPGLLHGRVVRPPSPGARLRSVDDARQRLGSSVTLVRDGDFLGVIAGREDQAARAAALLAARAEWDERETLPDESDLRAFLTSGRLETMVVDDSGANRAGAGDAAGAVTTVRASYSRPFIAHASIGPSVALASWSDGRLDVWSHSQGAFPLRHALAELFGLPDDAIVVHHAEGAGCYGHNGADDAAVDAALLARAVPGWVVRVQWSRADELGWAPFGAAMVVDVEADVDSDGLVRRWRHDVWSNTHVTRPGYAGAAGFLAAGHLAEPVARPDFVDRGGMSRNAMPSYSFPRQTIVAHCRLDMPVRTSSLRSLGAHTNVLAAESMIDELAAAIGMDPLALRLRNLDDERGREVLQVAAEAAGWGSRIDGDTGFGLGFARYKNVGGWCAVVAEVSAGHAVVVRKLTIAVDVGMVVNPDGVRNQVEGGAIQATSWTLKEQVRFDRTRVTSTTWDGYPILRFSEVPDVEVIIVDRPDQAPLGAGELAQGPTTAAIANGLYAAVGVRVRDLPLTPDRVAAVAARS